MTMMRWSFGINMLGSGLVIMLSAMIAVCICCRSCLPNRDNWNPATLFSNFSCTSFVLIFIIGIALWFFGTIGVDIAERIIRYDMESRVCAGDFLLGN